MQPSAKEGPPLRAPNDRSMAARYGQLILREGIAAIPVVLYYKQAPLDLLAQEVWFVSAILARKWDADLPYPDLQEMADNSGTTARQLRRYRANLESRGYLRVHERYDPATGRRLPNSYDFHGLFAAMEALLAAEPLPENAIRAAAAPLTTPDSPTRDYSFSARYGRVIAAAGIAAIPQALFTYQRTLHLSAVQVWFTCYILAHRWSTDLPYPSLRLMAARTGYSERHLHDIKDSLVAAGYLQVIGRVGPQGSQDTNAYDFADLFAALTAQIEESGAVRRSPGADAGLEATKIPEEHPGAGEGSEVLPLRRARRGQRRTSATPAPTDMRDPVPVPHAPPPSPGQRSNRTASSEGTRTVSSEETRTLRSEANRTASSEGNRTVSSEGNRTPRSGGTRTRSAERNRTSELEGTRTPGSDEQESIQEESIQEESDSNRIPGWETTTEGPGIPPRYSPYIAAVILDYSRELGDAFHAPANVTQAAHLWQESGLSEDAFVAQLHEARGRVRHYQGKQGRGSIENKMSYFFRTLRDLIQVPPPGGPAPGGRPQGRSG